MQTYYQDLIVSGVPVAEKVLRTIVVYFFLIVILRIAGRRTLGSLNSFDLVVLLLLSNTVQNALIGNDNSLVGGLVGAAALLGINYLMIRFLYNHRKADHAIEGGPTVLVRRGKYIEENLEKQLITHVELQAAARRQGITNMNEVTTARLETNGTVTFDLVSPTEDERRMSEIMARLERIETTLQDLAARKG